MPETLDTAGGIFIGWARGGHSAPKIEDRGRPAPPGRECKAFEW